MASEDRATFAVDLDAKGVEDGARSAAQAIEGFKSEITSGIDSLKGMQAALRALKGGGASSAKTVDDLKNKIAAQKATIAGTSEAFLKLGGSFSDLKPKPIEDLKDSITDLFQQAQKTTGPLGALSGKLASISQLTLRGGVIAGTLGLVGALVAVTGATIAATSAIAKYAAETLDARRSELLRLEGLTKIRYFMGGFMFPQRAADSATFLQTTIDKVSSSVAISRDKVAQYAGELYRMGLRSGNLQAALEGVSITAATQGETQAEAFKAWSAGAAMTGQSVRKLADDVKARLGGIAKAQMLSLSTQSMKLRENLAMLFSGLKLEPALEGIQKVTELFSQSSDSGRALKSILEDLFNPIGAAIGPLGMLIRRFWQGIIIGALDVEILFYNTRNTIRDATKGFREFFGIKTSGFDATMAAVNAGAATVKALAIALGAVAVVGGFLGKTFYDVVIAPVVKSINLLKHVFGGNWNEIGSSIIGGLVGGLIGSLPTLIKTLEDIGIKAWKAFKDKIGSHSPAKLFEAPGESMGLGVAVGAKRSKSAVESAARDLIDPKEITAGGASGSSASGKLRGGNTISIGDIHVNAMGAKDPEAVGMAVRLAIRDEILSVFEGAAIQMGASH